MTPEEYYSERRRLEKETVSEINKIKTKYKVSAFTNQFEPGDSQDVINARKECDGCKNIFDEKLGTLQNKFKKSYYDKINELDNYKSELDKHKSELEKLKTKEQKFSLDDLELDTKPKKKSENNIFDDIFLI